MSERDELIARLEAEGVKVDKRLGTEKLSALVADQDEPEPERIETSPSTAAPLEVDDTWPRQVAPIVWVDRGGRRYTDRDAAVRGDMELR